MKKIISIIIYCCAFTFQSKAQIDPALIEQIKLQLNDSDKVIFQKGIELMRSDAYKDALPYFEKTSDKHPERKELRYIAGVCCMFSPPCSKNSISWIQTMQERAVEIDAYYYHLAAAFEKNDSLAPAIFNYETELKRQESKEKRDEKFIDELKIRVARCNNKLQYRTKQNLVRVTTLGSPVNSKASEYCPLITSNESEMIFTYRGPRSKGLAANSKTPQVFFEDIYISNNKENVWTDPVAIDNLNTNVHDAAICLKVDGTELLIFRNQNNGKGDYYLSSFQNSAFSKPVLQSGLKGTASEGGACFVPNTNYIIFSSERKGGCGGKDLYLATRLKNNSWGNIKNLGPQINSKYDEEAPFVTADGKILFFSSNNAESIGGLDIFRSDLKDSTWQKAFNLGPPINTKNDDKYFIVRADGKVGYYSTLNPENGEQDIYKVEPGIPGKPVELLEITGFITVDGKPAAASVEIHSIQKNNGMNVQLKAEKNTGTFLTNLPAGDKYELVIRHEKFPQQVVELNTNGIDSFVVLNIFADFTSAEFDKKLLDLERVYKTEVVRGKAFNQRYFEEKYGNARKDSLSYKIQIGAYKFFENFSYSNILGFPRIIRHTDDDYITRFVMGDFKSYNEAQKLLKKIQDAKVLKDSFIIAIYKGKKKYLQELYTEKIFE